MSEFDEEAEREKLREKYGEKGDDQEATEHMSELLLQGATMTNKHCDTCGDPVFRQNGQEFCPTCRQAADGDVGRQTAQAEAAAGEGEGAAEPTERKPTPPNSGGASRRASPAASGGQEQPQQHQQATARQQQGADPAGGAPVSAGQAAETPTGDLADAQAALVDSITQLARQAAQESDPRQAKERLAAAREAAEALDALQR